MNKKIKIATWNVERPKKTGWKSLKRNQAIIEKINEIDADIWILTETNEIIKPSGEYFGIATPHVESHSDGENRSTIWSRCPVKRQLETFANRTAVCAEIETPMGSLLVYGTIITYHKDPGADDLSKPWEEHYKSIEKHSNDWFRLSQESLPLCIAGDFNETLAKPFLYRPKQSELLPQAIQRSNLVCVTAVDGIYRIDHICLSQTWADRVSQVNSWKDKSLSDHALVWVELTFE